MKGPVPWPASSRSLDDTTDFNPDRYARRPERRPARPRLCRSPHTLLSSLLTPLRFTSCQAPVAEVFCSEVAAYVGHELGRSTELVSGIPWPERLRLFDSGRIHVCWMCGLPYTWRADRARKKVELLAAPVMASTRYRGRPVYFSDVVVRSDSQSRSFDDLRGAIWAYNEDTSHSGYGAVRFHMTRLGHRRGFFGRIIEAGYHEASVRMLLDGTVDASAIDSTVLDLLQERDPSLRSRLRLIDVIGPSPIPPWVVSLTVPPAMRAALRKTLLGMHTDPEGRAILERGRTARFVAVTDRHYDPIRSMARAPEGHA
jgi:phosphonate transport system substrate-binding protein